MPSAEPHKRAPSEREKPLLLIDIDGVISLFGGPALGGAPTGQPLGGEQGARAPGETAGSFHSIDGMLHFISAMAAAHLLVLAPQFELVWCSGWEERADEHLPHLLGLPAGLPHLRFERAVGRANAHWKLDAIDAYAGDRALAWIDDALGPACHEWADARRAPTLLVETQPELGLTTAERDLLAAWARELAAA
jgi:hypothetical protein